MKDLTRALLNKRYQLVKPLGQGGMGRVYLAIDIQTKKQVALKQILIARHLSSKDLVKRFKREYDFLTYFRKKSPILYRWGMNCENKVFSDCW